MIKTLVIGLGNVLRGDDGFGAAVISALQEENLPSHLEVIDAGTPGLDLLMIWRGYQRVIIVDAVDMGLSPGQWRRISPGETGQLVSISTMKGSLHSAGLVEALALAEALGALPESLILYGVQPAQIDWSTHISDKVRAAVQPVSQSILLDFQSQSIN